MRESSILRFSPFIATILFSCGVKERQEVRGTDIAPLFTYIPSSKSGVTFKNSLSNSEYDNIIVNPHFYDGAGVAVGDINNDGLADIYFVSNQWENKLYLNKGDFEFEDITARAGVAGNGKWKTGVFIKDSNDDGLLDIYVYSTETVSDPVKENVYVFVNNGDLTFKESGPGWQPGLSFANSLADIDDDGWLDHFAVGKRAYDDRVLKTTSLQRPNELNITRDRFQGTSDNVAWYAGVAATDWGNQALIADFDNDGRKDIFITTGVVGRVNDLDYLNADDSTKSVEERYSKIPAGPAPNFFFKQKNDLKFDDVSGKWIGTTPTVSTGAAYADLDNDGDLDLVVNNTNAEAFVLRNELKSDSANYLKINLDPPNGELGFFGIKIKAGDRQFFRDYDEAIHVGLGANKVIDTLLIQWGRHWEKYQVLTNIPVNQTITLKFSEATSTYQEDLIGPKYTAERLLQHRRALPFKHQENAFTTLDKQPLIPHTNATRGPKMSVGDVNGDKLADVFICGGQGQPGVVMIQTKKGAFIQIPQPAFEADKKCEETCSSLFDIDGDRDLDLLIGSGGEEFLDSRLLLRLYINNGRGTFSRAQGPKRADIVSNLQKVYVNASCIAPADIDNDGDVDVFVGGGVVTSRYGFDSDSFILLNDGKGMLTGSPTSFDERKHPTGMVQSAVWIDINNDKFPELITAGEWMTPTLWLNDDGVLKEQTGTGLDGFYGWWNVLSKGDLDNDGDEDFVAGNFGSNIRFDVSKHPLKLYVTDVDNNETFELIMAYNDRPVATRDQLLKQAPALERRFPTYASYAQATVSQLVTGKVLFERELTSTASVAFLNQGNGKFVRKELPAEAQWFPVFAVNISDVNNDGKADVLLAGNLHSVSPEFNSDNDGYGLVLIGRGNGTFDVQRSSSAGFMINAEARDIQTLTNTFKEQLYLVAANNDSVYVFKKSAASR